MRYLSVCSGIEAASVAWHTLGWTPVAFSEIEAFPSAVLAYRYPTVPNWGDMTRYAEWPDADIDVLVGGTPCQSFSVAGLRKGLDDPRGNLMLTYGAIAQRYRPRWLVWENVPGVLSSDGGRDFGTFLGMLAELGYGFAYRVLDAQYVRVDGHPRAVPQRRRRVFVVGHLGDWRRAAAVLFERESLSGHPAPRREAGKAAPTIPSRSGAGGGLGTDFDCDGGLIAGSLDTRNAAHMSGLKNEADMLVPQVAKPLGAHALSRGRGTDLDNTTYAVAFDTTQVTSKGNYSNPKPGDPCHPLAAGAHPPAIAIQERAVCENPDAGPDGAGIRTDGAAYTLEARTVPQAAAYGMAVRRLTPRECERLQGFPDDYTLIVRKGKPAADGPRYKALGNSMAVNVMRWIGQRIAMVEEIAAEQRGGRMTDPRAPSLSRPRVSARTEQADGPPVDLEAWARVWVALVLEQEGIHHRGAPSAEGRRIAP